METKRVAFLMTGGIIMAALMLMGTSLGLRGSALAQTALATTDGDYPGIRIEVTELKRGSGGTVMLKFIMINDADQPLSIGWEFRSPEEISRDHNSISGVYLMDPVNKKKYLVIRDTDKNPMCSKLASIAPKSRASMWGKFPAPAENVQKITVAIPHFIPMDDVPISQ